MSFWRGTKIAIAYFLVLLFWQGCGPKPQQPCGFVQNSYGERITWQGNLPVVFQIHESFPKKFIPAIESAAKKWEVAVGRPLFKIITDPLVSGPNSSARDNANIIYFIKEWEADKPQEQARTIIHWVGDLIKESDILVNGKFKYYWGQDVDFQAVNIEAIFVHEFGHVLGLKHNDGGNSVMATYLANNTDRINISSDDIESMKCGY